MKKPKRNFIEVEKELEKKRILFRNINRGLHRANHEYRVNFKDE